MLKRNFFFCLVMGIGVGTTLGIALENIPMGVSAGAASGVLVLLLTVFEKDENK